MQQDTSSLPLSAWLKSSFCQTSSCVEVSRQGEFIAVRNSRHPDTVVRYTAEEWHAFSRGVRAGEFEHLFDL
jgi:hypothetical protein